MDPVLLARIQFALTVGFHFIFPPVTIGLAWLIVWLMARFKNTGDERWGLIARFWIKIFALTFVVGVATGIVMEFQFGTNWSEYSRFVGDIFGAPLAAEGIFSFFLESTFIGVLILGWRRVSRKVLWFSALMVAIGSTLSAFWIIVANSWQQTPAGYHIVGGRAELTSFWAAVFNPSTVPRFLHTLDASLITGAFFMLGISASFVLKGRQLAFVKEPLKVALIVAFISSVAELGLGHYHGVQVAATQPEKLAAIEGIFETEGRAPALVFGIPDPEAERMRAALRIPGALSLLARGSLDAEVKGLEAFPKDEWPSLFLTFYPFHLMVILGLYFIGVTAFGVLLLLRGRVYDNRLFLKAALWSIPLPFIANELGWITAEVGRQPWVVYRVLKTSDAASVSVSSGEILFSIIMFGAIYVLLFALWVFLLRRQIAHGFEDREEDGAKTQ
jgi:cytochrome d ubiquinol oxidase subunit I